MQEELQKLKEEFEQRIKALEDKYKSKEEFEPERGEKYWIVNGNGIAREETWINHWYDKTALENNAVFRTEEEAEFEAEKRKVLGELEKLGRPFKVGDQNWMIQYDIELRIFVTQSYEQKLVAYGNYYFDTKDELREAVEKIGEDRVKKYLFGVED